VGVVPNKFVAPARPSTRVSEGSKYLISLKYGLHVLQFAKGANAIEGPNLKVVITVLNTIKTAVQAGELDSAIAAATAKREKPNGK